MKRYGYVAVLVIGLAMIIAVLSVGKGGKYTDLAPEDAARFIKEHPDVFILDVRTPPEQARGVIPGAVLTTPQQVSAGRVRLPEDGPVFLYCRTGRRSTIASKTLAGRGRGELYNLSGGLNAWARAGLPVVVPMQAGEQPWFQD